MTIYFDLTTYSRSTDAELLKRINRRVAGYYLAVPLALEDDRVTVATAYPDNTAALQVLERLLQAGVVPVASPETAVREAIARIYPDAESTKGNILTWTDDPAWLVPVEAAAQLFSRATGRVVRSLDSMTGLDEVLERAWSGNASLLVAHASDELTVASLVSRSPTSLLLVRGATAPIDHILVALRGFGSDLEALDQILPLIDQEGAGTTVLPLSRSASSRLNDLLAGDSPARQHLDEFLNYPERMDIRVDVRLNQGDPITQIVTELTRGQYAMLVVAAEAEGQFVGQILSRIEHEGLWPERPILIIKPPIRIE